MTRYLPRASAVEAVQCNGDNADELAAACHLIGAPFKAPDGVSPNRKYAVWNGRLGTWSYAGVGDWVVVSEEWARVMSDADFVKQYMPDKKARR